MQLSTRSAQRTARECVQQSKTRVWASSTHKWRAAAANSDDKPSSSSSSKPDPAVPNTGYFKLADPNAEVYSKAGEKFDPMKKGGRYKPEFIWNTNWQEQLKIQEDLERATKAYKEQQASGAGKQAAGPGVVSLSRLGTLDDLNVDLTEQLVKAPRKSNSSSSTTTTTTSTSRSSSRPRQASSGSSSRVGSAVKKPAVSPSYQFKDMPSRTEARRFQRAARVSNKGTTLSAVGTLSAEEAAQKEAAIAAERVRYEALKREFQLWTVGAALLGGAICYTAYSRDTAISYGLGAVGGLIYLRLLGRSVDELGGSGGGGGGPRLLIPLILTLGYNRWNQMYAADTGVTLQLIPELLGFFTYKLAILTRQGLQIMQEFGHDVSYSSSSSGGEGGEGPEGQKTQEQLQQEAMSLDRIFVKKATTGW